MDAKSYYKTLPCLWGHLRSRLKTNLSILKPNLGSTFLLRAVFYLEGNGAAQVYTSTPTGDETSSAVCGNRAAIQAKCLDGWALLSTVALPSQGRYGPSVGRYGPSVERKEEDRREGALSSQRESLSRI